MKKFVFIALSVFLVQNVYALEFKGCSFKKIEKDTDGIFVIFNCKGDGTTKCFVHKNRAGFDKVESGEIWKSIPNKDLIVIKSHESGRSNYITQRNGRMEGWFTGDCLELYSKDKGYDVTNDQVMEKQVDDTNLKFEDDMAVIGTWKSVDFVNKESNFEPGKKQFKENLFLKEIKFAKKGKTDKTFWTWTKGVLIHTGDKTASAYEIKNIEGKDYMFLEWKSGDYTFKHERPKYYVLEKVVKVVKKK